MPYLPHEKFSCGQRRGFSVYFLAMIEDGHREASTGSTQELCLMVSLDGCDVCVFIWPQGLSTCWEQTKLSQSRTLLSENPKLVLKSPPLLWFAFLGTILLGY